MYHMNHVICKVTLRYQSELLRYTINNIPVDNLSKIMYTHISHHNILLETRFGGVFKLFCLTSIYPEQIF